MDEANVVALVQFEKNRSALALDFVKLEGQWLLAKIRFAAPPGSAP